MNNSKYRNYVLDGYGIIVMILALIFSSSLVGLVVFLAFEYFHKDIRYSDAFSILSYLFSFLPVIAAFDYFVMRRKGKVLNFNMQTRPFHVYLLIFPMMFGMMLIAEYTTSFIPISGPIFGEWYKMFSEQMETISEDTFTVFLLVSFFAPIIEEILFRGIIQKGMINNGVKPRNAIIISALVFGLVHFNPWQFIGAFLLGLVLGVVYFKTKSLLMPILLHFFNNTIAAIMMKFYYTESFSELLHIPEYAVLLIGIVLSGFVGLLTGGFGIWEWTASMGLGINNMGELIIVTLLAGGILEMIRFNGGIDWIILKLTSHVRTARGAELSIAGLVSFANLCTANNTIALIMAGPIAKDIATNFNIPAKRSASILDIFSCFVQGIIPYGAQLLMASGLAMISPIEIMQNLYYPYLLGFTTLLIILLRKRKV